MKQKQTIKDAAHFGVKVTVDKSLDIYSGKVLFPKKLEKANKMLAKLKMPLPA